ncbi:MAG TPA: endonuclease III domain-containing protein, partial [Anaerolineae bacterium]
FTRYLFTAQRGSLAHLFRLDTSTLRAERLTVYGIGPETADSIILYAARQPIFVVDAYTRRIIARLGLAHPDSSYDELQRLFMDCLPVEEQLFNEYHALIVALGKYICKKSKPRCDECPLLDVCSPGRERALDEAL